ncbi:MAG: OmpH family outer membrane protein, partial [Betaproteobacteria bacterium]|nr:OmpH family outer membrane protein [Betaproteobacteria bacterium]
NAQRNADVSSILDKANAVVGRVAREKGCDIVFQSAVYVNPHIDITDAVIRALDAESAARDTACSRHHPGVRACRSSPRSFFAAPSRATRCASVSSSASSAWSRCTPT